MDAHRERGSGVFGDAPPAIIKVPADLTTPVRAFLCLTAPEQDAFLLESVAGGEAQARYSFLGLDPAERFEAGERAAIRTIAEYRPCRPELIERHIAVHDVTTSKPEFAFQPLG